MPPRIPYPLDMSLLFCVCGVVCCVFWGGYVFGFAETLLQREKLGNMGNRG